MNPGYWIGGIGLLITFSTLVGNLLYRTGHMSARVEALESWRTSIRQDMHEISDELKLVGEAIKQLTTLVEERTERRTSPRT